MRTSRCTPVSGLRKPYAYWPPISMTAPLIPASSPSLMSRISIEKPWRSAQRVYMRMSISDQSIASVPPAPAAISICALRQSSGPRSSDRSSNARRSVVSDPASASSSVAIDGSGSTASSSSISRALFRRSASLSKGSTQPFSSFTRWTTTRACSWFPQKAPSAICSSRRPCSSRRRARSKMPPELLESLAQFAQRTAALRFCHGDHVSGCAKSRLPAGETARRRVPD